MFVLRLGAREVFSWHCLCITGHGSQSSGRDFDIDFCKSEKQVVDIFTKALSKNRFQKLRNAMGVQVKVENVNVTCSNY